MIHVAIDTDTMRRHLFGGWHLLTFLAARAREGKIQIHIPWINHHETLTGIRDQVEDLTARKQLDTGLAEIAKAQVDHASITELSKVVTQTRERLYEDTMNRYREWIASAQAEIIPLTLPQSVAAWEAYFSGNAPYRQAKNRSDLPDGFVLQALLEIASRVGKIHFIAGDIPFRQSCSQHESIVCHDNIYQFCSSQNFSIDVAKEKELQKRKLPIRELEDRTCSSLKRKLAGLVCLLIRMQLRKE